MARVDPENYHEFVMPERQELHVKVRFEDEAFWTTVDEFPGVFATGDSLAELRASLEEGIALALGSPGEPPPVVRLAPLRHEPVSATASSELSYA